MGVDMTEFADRPPPRLGRERGFSGTVRDELARLRGKNLGACAACGQPVYAAQNFTRLTGRVIHLRCPITARTPAPMAPSVRARSVARDR